jgi:hypothetical protein
MRPEDVRKLVGGYAAGTLTAQERRALFEAVLSDQDLFNELAREQPLKELLEDPRARRELLNAVSEQPTAARRFADWFGRPMFWAAVGSAAAVVVLVGIFLRTGEPPAKQQPVLVARREAPPAPQLESAAQPPAQKSTMKEVPSPLEKNQAVAAGDAAPPAEAKQTVAAFAARADLSSIPLPLAYRLLRGTADGDYSEVDQRTVFRPENRVRVVFEPTESGHLLVTSASRAAPLFDADVETAAQVLVDIPAGEQKLVVAFTGAGKAQPALIEIQIARQSAP